MSPACPCCGSIAVVKLDRRAACTNPRCADNGIIKPAHLFRQEAIRVPPQDPRRVAVAGGRRVMPVLFED